LRSFTIIGLSSFGTFLATELTRQGVDVLAVDIDEEKIERIKHLVQKAIIADATDPQALASLALEEMDGVVVSLGTIDSSVLTTLHLKELKIKNIISKALSEDHGRILERVGASQVIFPEKDEALRIARTLSHENILDSVPLAKGYSIVELVPPSSFLRKSLGELDLRRRYGVQIISVKEMVPENIVLVPTADYVVKDSDVLVVMGRDDDLSKLPQQ